MGTDMKMNPHISIVICTYSRAHLLARTLMSLEKLLDIEKAEVIVVDNNSLDDTAEVVLACVKKLRGQVNLRYVFEPRQGLSVARNTGIDEAKAPIIAFLDDDALPFINWLSSVNHAFQKYPDAAALGGIITPDFAIARPDWLIKDFELKYTIVNLGDRERTYPRSLYPFGANMAFRREALQGIRFPEDLGRKGTSLLSGEEAWIFLQLRKKGLNLYYIPGMTVRHHISEERLTKGWIKRRYYYQGVTLAMESKGFLSRLRIVSIIGLKVVYTAMHARFTQSPNHELLYECRRESIRGSIETLRLHGVEPNYE